MMQEHLVFICQRRENMQTVAIISILSVFIWFLMGVKNSVNLNNYTEDDLKKK
jgi:hypothetical protein